MTARAAPRVQLGRAVPAVCAILGSVVLAACSTTERPGTTAPVISFANLEPGDRIRRTFNSGTRNTPVINTDRCAVALCVGRSSIVERSASVMRTEFLADNSERVLVTYTADGRFRVNFYGGGRDDLVDRGRFRILRQE